MEFYDVPLRRLCGAGGQHAPGRTEPPAAVRAAHHLLLGHGLAVQAMRTARSDNRYGITLNLSPTTPASSAAADVDAARRVDGVTNRLFLDPGATATIQNGSAARTPSR